MSEDVDRRFPVDHDSIGELVAELSVDPERKAIALELGVLQSIYGDDALRGWHPNAHNEDQHVREDHSNRNGAKATIRYEIIINVSPPASPSESYPVIILVSLPTTYPASSPPQLQLLSKYVGAFSVDASLFGAVLRTYISKDGIEPIPGEVCVFDGVEWVKERCTQWLGEKISAVKIGEIMRGQESPPLEDEPGGAHPEGEDHPAPNLAESRPPEVQSRIPDGINIVEAEPIVDRKSVFIGRACAITDPAQVPLILSHLMSDRRIARAAHPIINAWRCRVGNVLHQDNDDDGETAAGGRLAHLLQILEVDNVLVVVTRYFGGIHLGPDRFKHINQAARNALELGGFLDSPESNDHGRRKGKSAHANGRR